MFKQITFHNGTHDILPSDLKYFDKLSSDSPILVVDLDGCLRQGNHRLHLLPSASTIKHHHDKGEDNKAWSAFNKESKGDTPLIGNINISNALSLTHTVVILTSCTYTPSTSLTLLRQILRWNIKVDHIFMRHPDNHKHPVDMKQEFIKGLTESIKADKIICMDDCSKNVDMFRENGCTALKVYYD